MVRGRATNGWKTPWVSHPGETSHEDVLHRISGELSNNKIDLLLVHVAEGAPEDLESTVEFRALKGAGLLGSLARQSSTVWHWDLISSKRWQTVARR